MQDLQVLINLMDMKHKHKLLKAILFCVLSVFCGILPYFGVFGIVECFLSGTEDLMGRYIGLIIFSILLKHLLFGTGTKLSHQFASDEQVIDAAQKLSAMSSFKSCREVMILFSERGVAICPVVSVKE